MTLMWLAAAFILGIFIGFVLLLSPILLLAGAAGALFSALILRRKRFPRLVLLMLCCLLLGSARSESAHEHIAANNVAFYAGQTTTLVGYVSSEPDNRDSGNNYVITVLELVNGNRRLPLGGQMELHTAQSQLFNQGDELQLTGLVSEPVNSPSVPYRSILANRGIYAEMAFPKAFIVGHVSLGLIGWADQIRSAIENSIKRALPEPEATFLIALLVGARSAQLGALAPVLIRTGLIHLIAISGIKIAIVAGTVGGFLQIALSKTPRLLISSTVLLSYWLVSGATVAGLRASIMWLLIFLATYLGRPTFGPVSLGLAAAVMLTITPSLFWDTGFQFTVIATAAICMFTPGIDRLLQWAPGALRASTSTTVAAQFGVLPLQIVSFHILSPVSLLANAVVLPFVPITMVIGFGSVMFPGSILTAVAYGLIHLMILIARWAAAIAPAFALTSVPLVLGLGYYGALVAAGIWVWRKVRFSANRARGEWLYGLSAAAVGLSVVAASPSPPDQISFPVPGSVLITWHGSAILIDGGAKPSVLLTALGDALPYPNQGLSAVIDTSPNAKNVASLTAVVQSLPVGEVVDTGLEYPSQTYARWRSDVASQGIPFFPLRPGLTVRTGSLVIRCLAPDGTYANPKSGSGILLITQGTHRILYLGEASATEQQDLAFTGQRLSSEAIISAVSIEEALARASGYRIVLAPTGAGSISLGR